MGELDQITIGSEEIEEDQTVHVEVAEAIDFYRVFQHLTLGGPVYITHRRRPYTNIVSGTKKSERYKMIQLGLVEAGRSGIWKSYRINKGFTDL